MDINFNWLPKVLLSVVKSPQTRVPVIIIGVLTIALIVGWCGGAKFQDRAAKLDVLHRLAGYRFLTRPGYACRIKDQIEVVAAGVQRGLGSVCLVEIAEEIVSILASDPNATVRLSVEIATDFPELASESMKRAVSENARSLGISKANWE